MIKDVISRSVPGSVPTIRNEIMRHPVQLFLFSNTFWFAATAFSSAFNFINWSGSTIAGGTIPAIALIFQGGIDVYKIFRRCVEGRVDVEQLSFEEHLDYYKRLHPDIYSEGIVQWDRKRVLANIGEELISIERKKTAEILVRKVEEGVENFENLRRNLLLADLPGLYRMLMQDGVLAELLHNAGATIADLHDGTGKDYVQLYIEGVSAESMYAAGVRTDDIMGIFVGEDRNLRIFKHSLITKLEDSDLASDMLFGE